MEKFKNYAHKQEMMDLSNHIVWYCQEKGVTLEILNDALEIVKKSFYTDAVIKGNKEINCKQSINTRETDMNKFSERLEKEVGKFYQK